MNASYATDRENRYTISSQPTIAAKLINTDTSFHYVQSIIQGMQESTTTEVWIFIGGRKRRCTMKRI